MQCVQDILGAGNPCIECICQIIDDICGIFGCDLNCHDPTTNTIHVQFWIVLNYLYLDSRHLPTVKCE